MNVHQEKIIPFEQVERFQLVDLSAQTLKETILLPFAFDEVYCRGTAHGWVPAVHIWRHNRAFVLGLRDRRLPFAETAMRWLEAQGFSVCVRNSGGAAVPLDPGVVNVSVIIPKPQKKADIRADFVQMARLIQETTSQLSPIDVRFGEVNGSYCPGEFDISIAGQKFCGISQRRQIGAIVVQAFVNVEGLSRTRAELVRRFYEIASGEDSGALTDAYPNVTAGKMTSLAELDPKFSTAAFVSALIRVLSGRVDRIETAYFPGLEAELEQTVRLLKERYDR